MESNEYTETAFLQDLQNITEFCRKYGMLSGEHFKGCVQVELSEKSIADYLGF